RESFALSAYSPTLSKGQHTGVSSSPTVRILLVEDNGDMRQYLRRLLTGEGYAVELAPDGVAALEAAQASPPDLVLSDVMLPRLDGIGLLRCLRQNPPLSRVPIILLSARAGEDFHIHGLPPSPP